MPASGMFPSDGNNLGLALHQKFLTRYTMETISWLHFCVTWRKIPLRPFDMIEALHIGQDRLTTKPAEIVLDSLETTNKSILCILIAYFAMPRARMGWIEAA